MFKLLPIYFLKLATFSKLLDYWVYFVTIAVYLYVFYSYTVSLSWYCAKNKRGKGTHQ